jgi:WD40 repeat protein
MIHSISLLMGSLLLAAPSPYELQRFDGHEAPVTSVVVMGDEAISAGDDGAVRRWDLETLEERGEKPVSTGASTRVAISPSGELMAATDLDEGFQFWVRTYPKAMVYNHLEEDLLDGVAFSPDGKWLAVAYMDGGVTFWDVSKSWDGKTFRTSFSDMKGEIELTCPVNGLAFSADSKRLIVVGDKGQGMIEQVWDVASKKKISETPSDGPGVAVARRGPDYCAGRMVRKKEGSLKLPAYWPQAAAVYAPDGKWLATGGMDFRLMLWDPANGELLVAIRAHDDELTSLAVTADGKKLLSGSKDGLVKVWDVAKLLADRPKEEPMAKAAESKRGYECWRLGLCWTRGVLNYDPEEDKTAAMVEAEQLAKQLELELPALPEDTDLATLVDFLRETQSTMMERLGEKYGQKAGEIFTIGVLLPLFQVIVNPQHESAATFRENVLPEMATQLVPTFGAVPAMFDPMLENMENRVHAEIMNRTIGQLIREIDMDLEQFSHRDQIWRGDRTSDVEEE